MAIDRDDLSYIEKEMEKIFVTRKECDDVTDEINRKLANDSTELALIKQTLNTISWVSKTTLATVIAVIVGAILKLIIAG